VVTVVAAVISNNSGKWLIAQRPEHKVRGGEWEFPGGKVEHGETHHQALYREIKEELNVAISSMRLFCCSTHQYADLTIELHAYQCVINAGSPAPVEHQKIAWVTTAELKEYPLSGADLEIADQLLKQDRDK
jgi:mutator protein MutT